MDGFTMKAGRAYYFGLQGRHNEILDEPPEPYLVTVPAAIAKGCRYAAHIAGVEWGGSQLMLTLYVDSGTHRMYAQPHHGTDAMRIELWRHSVVEQWSYQKARAFVHWLELHATYVNDKTPRKTLVPRLPGFWDEYVKGARHDKGPMPLSFSIHPERDFADKGWIGWESWFWPPRPSRAARPERSPSGTAG